MISNNSYQTLANLFTQKLGRTSVNIIWSKKKISYDYITEFKIQKIKKQQIKEKRKKGQAGGKMIIAK